MKLNKHLTILTLAFLSFTGCDDNIDPVVTELEFSRVFGPSGLTTQIRTLTTIELKWDLRKDVDHYVVEFHEDSLEFTNLVFTDEVAADELPYRHTLAGETLYSVRVKCVSSKGLGDSQWATATARTLPENIFLPLPGENVQDTYATLLWTPGSEVTHFIISPGNIQRNIVAGEKAAGEATITGLTGSTDYSVTLYNGTKRRGVVAFSTQREANVFPTDNLSTVIANAADGSELILAPGNYMIGGAIALTKSIKIEGQKSYDKPVIYGQLTCGTTVGSVELKSLSFRGDENPASVLSQFFNTVTGCNLSMLTIDDCEISFYQNSLISNNASGVYGAVVIKNSYIHDMLPAAGGDGIDIRGGTMTSLSIENTTFSKGFRSFLRMQVNCATSFKNCTFYKLSALDNSNNSGLFRSSGGGTLEVRNCLFVETGIQSPVNIQSGNFCRQASNMTATPTYANNNIFSCYNIFVGLYTTAAQVSATELNPGLVDPENGNFKITNQTIIDNNIGDLTWQ